MDIPFFELAPVIAIGVVAMSIGWVVTTWLRIKHGYPLETPGVSRSIPRPTGKAWSESSC